MLPARRGQEQVREDSSRQRWTDVFGRLPEEKQRRVLDAAKKSFAALGFGRANVNDIAADAGISVGSMYKYFRTKEDLFLALVEESHDVIATTIDHVLAREQTLAGRVEGLLRAAVEAAETDPEAVHIYIACTTEELSPLAARLSGTYEDVAAVRYRQMLDEARRRGEVDADLDVAWAAFALDNLFLLAQLSVGAAYFRERLKVFLGDPRKPLDREDLMVHLRDYILRMLGSQTA
jgi:TetR/AcrR family transcriptional regulator